jgi:hypothetical protein
MQDLERAVIIFDRSHGSDTLNEVLFAVTIDTEEEWDWSGPFPSAPFSTHNAQRLGKFQSFCERIGLKPTWLIDHAIAEDPNSANQLRSAALDGRCEIGAHLHPWATPPHEEVVNETHSHIVNLPLPLVEQKLANLTDKLESVFGRRPTSFRAGRWGLNGRLLRLLRDHGYTVDTSVHPFYANDAFSYENAPCQPYWPDFENLLAPGSQREILELPATSGFNVANFDRAAKVHRLLASPPFSVLRAVGLLWHSGLLRKISLSPELFGASDMLALARACVKQGQVFLNLYFHSSSLLPGGTAYVPNEAAERSFYGAIESLCQALRETCKVRPVTLAEARDCLIQEHQPQFR